MSENSCQAMSRDGEGNCLAHGGECCYNQALLETKEQLMAWGMPEDTAERSIAPLRRRREVVE